MAEPTRTLFDEMEQATATPTNPPFPPAEDDPSPSPSPEPTDEETIYSFLFQKCDRDESGQVAVESLVEYIHKMQSGQQDTSEEVYDSLGESRQLRYNLDLLKAMLECNSDAAGCVDQATYSHIIRKWVKNIRDREDEGGSPIEVSQLSDSEDGEEGVAETALHDFSYGSYGSGLNHSTESFETSGGGSSHAALDRVELMNSVADLRLDNKRLQERNQELQLQMENSDEHFKGIQRENEQLQGRLKNVHQNLSQVEELKTENHELNAAIQREREKYCRLEQNSEKMERDLEVIQEELGVARVQLASVSRDHSTLSEEMQRRLLQKEEQLQSREEAWASLEEQLLESQRQSEALSRTVADLGTTNDELRSSNAELQTRLQENQTRPPRPPFSSTPFRREIPSLHDELMARDEAEKRGSITPFLVGVAEGEELQSGHTHSSESIMTNTSEASMNASRILDESFEHYKGVFDIHNPKIHQRSNQLVREFTDIIAAPSPSSSHRSTHESSRLELTERLPDRKRNAFESKLADLVKRKKQLQNENAKMAAEMAELRQRNAQLERERAESTQQEQVDHHETAIQTDPLPVPVAEPVFLAPLQEPVGLLEIHVPETLLEPDSLGGELETTGQLEPPAQSESPARRRLIQGQYESPGQLLTAGQPEAPGELLLLTGQPETPGRDRSLLSVRSDTWSISPTTTTQPPKATAAVSQQKSTSSRSLVALCSSAYRILRGVALLLVITLLVLLLIVAMIMLHDALDSCGTYCPHSPVQMLYETFGSHLQFSRLPSPI